MLLDRTVDTSQPKAGDLIAEANHRIANHLGLIAALTRKEAAGLTDDHADLPPAQVRAMLGELVLRIEAVGRLHRALSATRLDGWVDVGVYLQQVASETVSSLARPEAVTLHFGCELGCRVPGGKAAYIGLMIVELLVNAVKYAHPAGIPGCIEVSTQRDPRGIVISIADDGVGLPVDLDPGDRRHSGIRLVQSLAAHIGATIRFDNRGLGLEVEIVAPIAAAVE